MEFYKSIFCADFTAFMCMNTEKKKHDFIYLISNFHIERIVTLHRCSFAKKHNQIRANGFHFKARKAYSLFMSEYEFMSHELHVYINK